MKNHLCCLVFWYDFHQTSASSGPNKVCPDTWEQRLVTSSVATTADVQYSEDHRTCECIRTSLHFHNMLLRHWFSNILLKPHCGFNRNRNSSGVIRSYCDCPRSISINILSQSRALPAPLSLPLHAAPSLLLLFYILFSPPTPGHLLLLLLIILLFQTCPSIWHAFHSYCICLSSGFSLYKGWHVIWSLTHILLRSSCLLCLGLGWLSCVILEDKKLASLPLFFSVLLYNTSQSSTVFPLHSLHASLKPHHPSQ